MPSVSMKCPKPTLCGEANGHDEANSQSGEIYLDSLNFIKAKLLVEKKIRNLEKRKVSI